MVQDLETYRGEIFQLYIVFDRTASDVIAILKQHHNYNVT